MTGVYSNNRMVSFAVPLVPLSLNELNHMHWAAKLKHRRAVNAAVEKVWEECGRRIFTRPVKLRYVLGFEVARQRDRDNYIGGTKDFTDALRRTFLFRDDSEFVVDIRVAFLRNCSGTVIIIEEA